MKYIMDHTDKPYRKFFEDISQIPHGSRNEKALSDYLVSWAKERKLWVLQDDKLNVIIKKPGSKGYENSKPLMLQGHIDMVCEKNADSTHDFEKDPLDLYVEDGWLKARGTTLGADDGIAVAYMMAVLDSDDVDHPPLECVFTTEEEIGLHGAMALDPANFAARRLISMDGGGESVTMVSSAGGMRTKINIPVTWKNPGGEVMAFAIRGLSGGHSGGEIDKEKGNANQLAVRILYHLLREGLAPELIAISGGLKDNAIPREAEVIVSVADVAQAKAIIKKVEKEIQVELQDSDAGFNIIYPEFSGVMKAVDKLSSKKIIEGMYLMPNGMLHRSQAIADLVVTSMNMGIIETDEKGIRICYSLRSTLDSRLMEMAYKLEVIAAELGAACSHDSRYPGWDFQKDSKMRDIFLDTYKRLRAEDAQVIAAHGGCECGIFKNMFPEMDIVTLGPIMEAIHTPQEKLNLDSFDRTYEFLKEYLKVLKD